MLTRDQLAVRQTGVGASEVAAIVGVSEYEGALDVYLRKTGLVEPKPENEFMRWGNKLEAVVATEYAERLGVVLDTSDTVRHPVNEWALATPDRIVRSGEGEAWLLEVKTTAARKADEWGEVGTDQVPHRVAIQCQWQMYVTGYRRCDVAVLIGGSDFRTYTLWRDDEVIAALVAQVEAFWRDHVEANEPPPLDGSESAHRYLALKYPKDVTPLDHADERADHAMQELAHLKAELAELERQVSEREVELKALIGDREGLVGVAGKATWKLPASGAVSWKKVADELRAPASLVAKYTSAPTRRFIFTPAKE